ncbi:MAG: hypothetical protein K0S33_1619 [Bacteroidetes bacterium]|jgi:hypothetical protein|nr:hypothetical protein [Bacteroidota bacterium]
MCHKSNIGCLDSDEEIDVAPMELIGVYAFYLLKCCPYGTVMSFGEARD